MAKVILYYAHPGHRYSAVNRAMFRSACEVNGISVADLYAEYPRFNIDIDREQKRLLDHDVILFQYPVFWYSSPALVKEWLDLVLEHGFAYGVGGDRIEGKTLMLALTAAGPEDAYSTTGYQGYPIRTFLTPMERTARLCRMHFAAPYVLYSSLRAADVNEIEPHVSGYRRLLEALRDDRYDLERALNSDLVTYRTLPVLRET